MNEGGRDAGVRGGAKGSLVERVFVCQAVIQESPQSVADELLKEASAANGASNHE